MDVVHDRLELFLEFIFQLLLHFQFELLFQVEFFERWGAWKKRLNAMLTLKLFGLGFTERVD